ncbi:MAG TPA: transposase [Verrucomicrobiae bacterium]
MARKLRIQFPGAVYHVMNRGDRREAIFSDDADRASFLETLSEACEKGGWWIHAFCLMTNHFHLVVETPQGNLVAGMKWFLGTYTRRFNRRHREFGHLFSGRYKALVINADGSGYFKTACDYVHLNPARANLLLKEQPLEAFAWSSYPLYLKPGKRPDGLRVDRLLGEWHIPQDSESGREFFAECMERRRQENLEEEFRPLRRGWCLGDEEFRSELLEQVQKPPSYVHYGESVQEAVEARAERLVREGLGRLGWTEMDLAGRAKGHPLKIQLANELRTKTTMPLDWIAARLGMGSRGYLAWLLQQGKDKDVDDLELI